MLHASTRESLGISLKDSIVIIDEAHNVIETVTAIHTVVLTLNQIRTALSQLAMYMERYRSRLLGKNVAYIKQVMAIVKALIRILQPKPDQKKDRVLGVNEFVHLLNIDHMNMFKIEKYLKESRLAQKLNGFIDKQQQREKDITASSSVVPTLTQIEAFILTLTNPDKDGRIVLTFGDNNPQVKYMLLNPAEVFEPIVRDAKSIILAGGTMEPVNILLQRKWGLNWAIMHALIRCQISRASFSMAYLLSESVIFHVVISYHQIKWQSWPLISDQVGNHSSSTLKVAKMKSWQVVINHMRIKEWSLFWTSLFLDGWTWIGACQLE